MKKCPYCAEDIQDAAVVCKHCGRDLVAGASQVQIVAPPKKTSPAAWGCLTVIVIFAVLIIIGQCGTQSSPPSRTPSTPAATPPSQPAAASASRRNPTDEQLASFVVRVGEEPCPQTKRKFFQGIDASQEVWNVECSTGKSYSVTLENSGTVRVLACSVLRTVSKVECFKTFDEQRRR